jgi:hypothetical protein
MSRAYHIGFFLSIFNQKILILAAFPPTIFCATDKTASHQQLHRGMFLIEMCLVAILDSHLMSNFTWPFSFCSLWCS